MKRYKLTLGDLKPYLPMDKSEISKNKIKYIIWVTIKNGYLRVFYYSVEHSKFKARPFRTQGTYSKYISIDDKIDDLHWYTTLLNLA